MLRATLSRAMWIGRGAAAVFGLALVLALVMGVGTMALAAVPGDPFRLGQTNGIDTMSTLVGSVAGTMLRVDNNSTAAGATALDLRVEAGKAPMKVNSATRVANLNADRVDGKDSAAFALANTTPMWAVVNSDGTLRRSSPGVIGSSRISTANYQITFNRDVTACAYIASIESVGGEIGVSRAVGFDTAQQMRVNPVPDNAFHLVVFC